MRPAIASLLAASLGGAVACGHREAPTSPLEYAALSPSALVGDQATAPDFTGGWLPDYNDYGQMFWVLQNGRWQWTNSFPDAGGPPFIYCEAYAITEYQEWNRFFLKQDDTHVTGAIVSLLGSNVTSNVLTCALYGMDPANPTFWSVKIPLSGTFDGRIQNNILRLDLNQHMGLSVTLDPGGQTMRGTLRLRIDPRPDVAPFWVEKPIRLSRYDLIVQFAASLWR